MPWAGQVEKKGVPSHIPQRRKGRRMKKRGTTHNTVCSQFLHPSSKLSSKTKITNRILQSPGKSFSFSDENPEQRRICVKWHVSWVSTTTTPDPRSGRWGWWGVVVESEVTLSRHHTTAHYTQPACRHTHYTHQTHSQVCPMCVKGKKQVHAFSSQQPTNNANGSCPAMSQRHPGHTATYCFHA